MNAIDRPGVEAQVKLVEGDRGACVRLVAIANLPCGLGSRSECQTQHKLNDDEKTPRCTASGDAVDRRRSRSSVEAEPVAADFFESRSGI